VAGARSGHHHLSADNGVHADLVLPARPRVSTGAASCPSPTWPTSPADAEWIAFGAGERRVYLETPTWGDLTLKTAADALTGGEAVMHVEWTETRLCRADNPADTRAISPLWAAIRAGFELDPGGKPIRIDHPGYGFGRRLSTAGAGKANAIHTCNHGPPAA
jgi:hypothetical protein